MHILITTSGIGSRLGELTKYTNKALVKIGDKFTINYIIDIYKNIPNIRFIITLGYYGDFVKQYLLIAYPELQFTFINIDNYDKVGSSLGYSLLQTKNYINEPFIFHCCDCIINELNLKKINLNNNILFVYKGNNSTNYSSINVSNNNIIKINDKGEKIFDYIYIGIAYIKDFNIFFNILEKLYKINKNKILSDIHVYMEILKLKINIKYSVINNWQDTGSIHTFINNNYFNCKYNVLNKNDESICFMNNKVVKFFYDTEKNLNRIKRSKNLQQIIPHIYNYSKNFHSMELINSKPLSEIYEYGLIYKLLLWGQKNLWIEKKNKSNFKEVCRKFYYDKTINRIKKALKSNVIIDFNVINGVTIGNIYSIIEKIDFNLLTNSSPSNYHGDFILDNILLKNNSFCLIDWRQDFGGDLDRGDMYYDLAKLRHNIYLNHSNLENKLFNITEIKKNNCVLDIKCNYFLIKQLEEFDKFINDNNLNLKKIKILTALIWINMAPLHDYPLSNFLFNFGKFNLYLETNQSY